MARGNIPFRMRFSYYIAVAVGIAADVLVLSGNSRLTFENWLLVAFFYPLLLALLSVALFKYFFYLLFRVDPGEFRFNGLAQPSIENCLTHPSPDVRYKARMALYARTSTIIAHIWLLVTIPATLKLAFSS